MFCHLSGKLTLLWELRLRWMRLGLEFRFKTPSCPNRFSTTYFLSEVQSGFVWLRIKRLGQKSKMLVKSSSFFKRKFEWWLTSPWSVGPTKARPVVQPRRKIVRKRAPFKRMATCPTVWTSWADKRAFFNLPLFYPSATQKKKVTPRNSQQRSLIGTISLPLIPSKALLDNSRYILWCRHQKTQAQAEHVWFNK